MKMSETQNRKTDFSDDVKNVDELNPNVFVTSLWLLLSLGIFGSIVSAVLDEVWNDENFTFTNVSNSKVSRNRRFLYMTSDRLLNLPPGTILNIEATWSFPGFNTLPVGLSSETAISIPVIIDFDDMGFTSEENTFGEIPFMDEIWNRMEPIRNLISMFLPNSEEDPDDLEGDPENDLEDDPSEHDPELDIDRGAEQDLELGLEHNKLTRKGSGDRSVIYQVIEDALDTMGIDGKACLLKTICEIHQEPIFGHGIFGEFLQLLLSVRSSTGYQYVYEDYLEAEKIGRNSKGCDKYALKCPLSIFAPLTHAENQKEAEIRDNFRTELKNLEIKEKKNRKYKKKYYNQKKESKQAIKKNKKTVKVLSREKRFLFFGPAGRIRLPLGSIFIIKPQIELPFMGNLPEGYYSGIDLGVPFRVIFDDLGLTSVLNPFLTISPFLDSSFRKKRDTWRPLPGVNFAGGDREFIFTILEHSMNSWKFDGRGCLLRAICEAHMAPLKNYGFFGEVLRMFLSPSRSLHAELRLQECVAAENFGKRTKNCKQYISRCPHSLFVTADEINRRKSARDRKQSTNLNGDDEIED